MDRIGLLRQVLIKHGEANLPCYVYWRLFEQPILRCIVVNSTRYKGENTA